ncbi:MAG: hypothetical protein ABI693_16730 [Bryobacteraceae bacterium]
MRRCLFFLLTLPLLADQSWIAKVEPVPAATFPIIAWNPSPTDAGNLALMKQAGLNVSGFCQPEDLDKVQAAGLSCLVNYGPIDRMIERNEATDAEIQKAVADLKTKISGHPAAFGVYLRDEPSTAQMPILGRIAAVLRKAMPEQLPYVNLFPTYATPEQLGAEFSLAEQGVAPVLINSVPSPTKPISAPT